MHAKSRLAVLATILVAIILSGCRDVTVNNYIFTGFDGRVDTIGNCIRSTTLGLTIQGFTPGTTVNPYPVGEVDSISIDQDFAPSGCGTPNTWNFVSSNPGVVSVTKYNSTSARIQSVSPGQARITAQAVEDPLLAFQVDFVVPGTATVSSITYTPSGGTITTASPTRTLTAQCTQGTDIATACSPSWYSTNPNAVSVDVGPNNTAVVTRRNPGTADVCVKWSPTRTTPYRCFSWTAQ